MHQVAEMMLTRWAQARELYTQTYEDILSLREKIVQVKDGPSNEDLTNLVYITKKTSELCDDLRKELNELDGLAGKIVCAKWMKANANDVSAAQPIRATVATGTPDLGQIAAIPKPKSDPEGYSKLLTFLGVPDDKHESGMIRVHWPSFQKHCNELASQGKPLPPGIDPSKTYPDYKLKVTKSRKIELLELFEEREGKEAMHEECIDANDDPF